MGKLLAFEEREQVEALARRAEKPEIRRRAQVLLLYDEGLPTREVAERASLSRGRARFWRRRYQTLGMQIFSGSALADRASFVEKVELDGGDKPAGQPDSGSVNGSNPRAVENAGTLESTVEITAAAADTPEGTKAERRAAEKAARSAAKVARAAEKVARADQRLQELLAMQKPGVRPDDTLAEAGRKVMAYQFAEVARHEAGTRLGEDIEELHDMRVATRRLRAAFEVFEAAFDPKVVKAHLKGLRAAGRALGRVRDLDVFMEKAGRYLETLPEDHRQGLEPLLSAWGEERESGRDAMLAHLDGEEYAAFKRKFIVFLTTPGKGAARPASAGVPPGLVRHIAPVLIYSRLGAVRAYQQVLETASIEQLHALRIEFKKLRYSLEFFKEVLGKEVKEVIDAIKVLQDHLGDLNDADVACQILRAFLDDWETRQLGLPVSARQNPEPVVAYLAAKHAERHQLMAAFQQAWEIFDQPDLRARVASAVSVL